MADALDPGGDGGCGLWVVGCGLWVVSCGLWVEVPIVRGKERGDGRARLPLSLSTALRCDATRRVSFRALFHRFSSSLPPNSPLPPVGEAKDLGVPAV